MSGGDGSFAGVDLQSLRLLLAGAAIGAGLASLHFMRRGDGSGDGSAPGAATPTVGKRARVRAPSQDPDAIVEDPFAGSTVAPGGSDDEDAGPQPQGDEGEALKRHLMRFSMSEEGGGGPFGGGGGGAFGGDAEEPLDDAPATTSPPARSGAAAYKSKRRTTVSGPSTNLAESRSYRPVEHPKTPQEEASLRRSLRSCQLFSNLDDDELALVVAAMGRVSFAQNAMITMQGDAVDFDTERFMVIASGEVSVIKNGTVLRVLRPWQYFNERHLMFVHSECRLTHRVDTASCECFVLPADAYRHIVTRVAVDKSELYEGFLDRVTWLKGLTNREKMHLADSLQAFVYNDGDYLIEYDTVGHWLYLIVEGTVEVFGRQGGEVVPVCEFTVGDCVGELEFLNNHRTVADVRAKGRVKAARLHRDHFELCMGPIVDVLRRSSMADERFAYYRAVTDAGGAGEEAAETTGGSDGAEN